MVKENNEITLGDLIRSMSKEQYEKSTNRLLMDLNLQDDGWNKAIKLYLNSYRN